MTSIAMSSIVVAPAVQSCLVPLTVQTELRSEDGTLLGYFTPASAATADLYEAAKRCFDPDVIRQRGAHAGPWLTTAETIDRLTAPEGR